MPLYFASRPRDSGKALAKFVALAAQVPNQLYIISALSVLYDLHSGMERKKNAHSDVFLSYASFIANLFIVQKHSPPHRVVSSPLSPVVVSTVSFSAKSLCRQPRIRANEKPDTQYWLERVELELLGAGARVRGRNIGLPNRPCSSDSLLCSKSNAPEHGIVFCNMISSSLEYFWSILQKEYIRQTSKCASHILETTVMEIFTKHGYPSSNKLTAPKKKLTTYIVVFFLLVLASFLRPYFVQARDFICIKF
jgi:hypothetical protein